MEQEAAAGWMMFDVKTMTFDAFWCRYCLTGWAWTRMSEPAGYFSTSPSGAAAAAKLSGVAAAVAVILALLLFPMPRWSFR